VLVASHLDVEPWNYPCLLFATGKKRKEFLRALVQRGREMKNPPFLVFLSMWLLLLVPTGADQPAQPALDAGLAAFRAGDYGAARGHFDAALKSDPERLAARFWRGRCGLELGDLAGATADLEAVVKAKPESLESWRWLARAYERGGQWDAAIAACDRALALAPEDVDLQGARARLAAWREAAAKRADRGHRTGVRTERLKLDVSHLEVSGAQVYDYTFAQAPTDWIPMGGEWAVTNRFACDPRWSFYGGHSRGTAAIWNKRRFVGDLAVEYYVAFKHGLPQAGAWGYIPRDINLTLCGDGRDLSSGYTFFFSGDHGQRTMITRGLRVLAETRDAAFLTPSFADRLPMENFHRRWWRLEARKEGARLSFFVDGQKALEVEDPEPLTGGQIALWTVDNGVMLSRMRVQYEQELPSPRPLVRLASAAPISLATPGEGASRNGSVGETPAGFPFRLRVSSPTHPSIANDFEEGLGEFAPSPGDGPPALQLDESTAAGGRRSLKITNTVPGGAFGVEPVQQRLDVGRTPHLSFDYRVPPEVKVNLYLKVAGREYEIGFTGPPKSSGRTTYLGRMENVVADGEWHHAEADLLSLLRPFHPEDRRLAARSVFFGNQHEENYLLSGFGGNQYGVSYHLDNFLLCGAGGRTVRLQWEAQPVAREANSPPDEGGVGGGGPPPDEGGVGGGFETSSAGLTFSYALDRNPASVPDTVPEGPATEKVYEEVADGTWYFHLRGRAADGTWSEPVHYPVLVDHTPPEVDEPTPADGARACPLQITLAVRDPGAGLDPTSLRLRVQDREYEFDNRVLRYDALAQRVLFDLPQSGLQLATGDTVAVSLLQAADLLEQARPEPYAWSWTFDPAQDTDPPQHPRLAAVPSPLAEGSFEFGLEGWEEHPSALSAQLSRTDETAAAGKYSLRLACLQNGSPFDWWLWSPRNQPRPKGQPAGFDAGQYRILSFDYKVPQRLRVDFVLSVNGQDRSIQFTDNDNLERRIGQVPNVQADNEWHHAEVNLYEMLRRDDPTASRFLIKSIRLTGGGVGGGKQRNHPGNYAGTEYFIDNLELVPVAGGEGELQWTATDASGIAGAWVVVSQEPLPDTLRPEQGRWVEGTGLPLRALPEGPVYLAAWLRDRAGNVSAPVFTRAWIDHTRPQLGEPTPANGIQAAPAQVVIPLQDGPGSGIDPSHLALRVQDIDYTAEDPSLRYDPQAGALIWDGRRTAPPTVFPDGTEVTYTLLDAWDYAGNRIEGEPTWRFTMDYAQDRTGPRVAVTSTSHPSLVQDTFEVDQGEWFSPDASAQLTRDPTTAASGDTSLKITNHRDGGPFRVIARREPFPASSAPLLRFDYLLPPGLRVDLVVQLEMPGDPHEGHRAIKLTDLDSNLPPLGRFPGVQADGQWHTAEINLADLLREDKRARSGNILSIGFGDFGRPNNPRGASFHLDNFSLTRESRAPVRLTWDAADETGVTGYSFTLDAEPGTVPDEESEGEVTKTVFRQVPASRCYFHIRAQDGAGNWGPPTHYLLAVSGGQ